jgi:glycine dehydrogenase
LEHRAAPVGIEIEYFDAAKGAAGLAGEFFGVLVQYPGSSGNLTDLKPIFAAAKKVSALSVAVADLLALCLIEAPGSAGADISVGTTQRFGVPMGFGGPHAGYLAVREDLERSMPGRLVGVSLDADGAPAYRLTLQTREQHIRRERATSNICTAQVLLAVMAGMYAVYHGPKGLRAIATEVHHKTLALAEVLKKAGLTVSPNEFFDTFQVTVPSSKTVYEAARKQDITMLVLDDKTVGISIDETIDGEMLNKIAATFGAGKVDYVFSASASSKLGSLARKDEYLTHQVLNSHHSETAMLRYLKRLADYD